jgi:hypothetical protein
MKPKPGSTGVHCSRLSSTLVEAKARINWCSLFKAVIYISWSQSQDQLLFVIYISWSQSQDQLLFKAVIYSTSVDAKGRINWCSRLWSTLVDAKGWINWRSRLWSTSVEAKARINWCSRAVINISRSQRHDQEPLGSAEAPAIYRIINCCFSSWGDAFALRTPPVVAVASLPEKHHNWSKFRIKINFESTGTTQQINISDPRSHRFGTGCTPLLKAELFIEPPPDAQRIRKRGERGIGVVRSSYLFLTSLSSLLPPPSPHTVRLLHRLGLRYQD